MQKASQSNRRTSEECCRRIKAAVNRTAGVLKYTGRREDVAWRSKLGSGSNKREFRVRLVACVSCVGGTVLGSRSRTKTSDAGWSVLNY